MYKNIFKLASVPLVLSMFVLPGIVSAVTDSSQDQMNTYYQTSQTQSYQITNTNYGNTSASVDQQIAYLYTLVAQLQAQLAVLLGNAYPNSGNNSSRDISQVVTGGVESDNNDAVVMDGNVTFKQDTKARVWFEYGVNTNLSYSTESIEINGDDGDTEDFEIEVSDFDDNKLYYYRAVAEDDNGNYIEGVIKSFYYDVQNNDDDDEDTDDTNNDWSLEVDDDVYETGDSVRVDYEVGDEDNDNWIGLYEVGDTDNDYISRTYVDDEEGYVTFRISNDGEYEFRLFDEDEDEQATSDEFEVED